MLSFILENIITIGLFFDIIGAIIVLRSFFSFFKRSRRFDTNFDEGDRLVTDISGPEFIRFFEMQHIIAHNISDKSTDKLKQASENIRKSLEDKLRRMGRDSIIGSLLISFGFILQILGQYPQLLQWMT